MTIEQVLDLNNRAVFFINEAPLPTRHPAARTVRALRRVDRQR